MRDWDVFSANQINTCSRWHSLSPQVVDLVKRLTGEEWWITGINSLTLEPGYGLSCLQAFCRDFCGSLELLTGVVDILTFIVDNPGNCLILNNLFGLLSSG